ncbi:MAG: carboxylating nicotinate-nucleotide diphosphorylase [Verrucomicrobiae bacterium]|nr:carboxylating nicotinate-nucleotide diphosphorylase [Verrucomicrobiae bacterium]
MTDSEIASASASLIDLALAEDLGPHGDITAQCFVPAGHRSCGRIIARQPLVVSGVAIAAEVFSRIDPTLSVTVEIEEGSAAEAGETVITVTGPTRGILTGERTALNFLQRLCGVATQTREYVRRATAANPAIRVLDTRKTTPGWRLLEKVAVLAGGGTNHRIGLYDAAMVKDNHLVAENRESSLEAGIRAVREQYPETAFIELEADRIDQVKAFLSLEGVDVILLDNMSLDQLREAVTLRDQLSPGIQLEASGGVTLDTIADIAATGVDAVSVGALTHSATAADLALDLETLAPGE